MGGPEYARSRVPGEYADQDARKYTSQQPHDLQPYTDFARARAGLGRRCDVLDKVQRKAFVKASLDVREDAPEKKGVLVV